MVGFSRKVLVKTPDETRKSVSMYIVCVNFVFGRSLDPNRESKIFKNKIGGVTITETCFFIPLTCFGLDRPSSCDL